MSGTYIPRAPNEMAQGMSYLLIISISIHIYIHMQGPDEGGVGLRYTWSPGSGMYLYSFVFFKLEASRPGGSVPVGDASLLCSASQHL